MATHFVNLVEFIPAVVETDRCVIGHHEIAEKMVLSLIADELLIGLHHLHKVTLVPAAVSLILKYLPGFLMPTLKSPSIHFLQFREFLHDEEPGRILVKDRIQHS